MARHCHIQEQAIPQGLQVYEERLEVSGTQYRRKPGASFVKGKEQTLSFEAEPGNKFDRNAIKVIGHYKGVFGRKRKHIGYVPAPVAQQMQSFGLSRLQARLLKTFLGKTGYVEVLFQVLGPKGEKNSYQALDQRG